MNASSVDGAESERRKLSISFQRPISGMCVRRVDEEGPFPKIHGNNCQSPRTQRCWRDVATS